ncbi:TetR/AcrR family transcriptional regulator [Polycladomyces sp. WAk]|uniref:TetR/AcrR family transcriptional regulator n=1 Tax=Polycladomyces zharkentensis TaxID=2807616 RepID=A0ABS2WMC2_9BACL|nr:TetR/AcrR family transcriptional regulator [Polycladomyces sp. WAk]MBN2910440.1 TetR/AcrR family transcriptional regulator [Polycladomyces sp. WAk]
MKYKSGEQTKQQMIDTAFRLIAEKGYDAMSIDDIMSEIGKTKGAFYTHFQSKEDLLYEVMRTRLDRTFGEIAEETLAKLKEEPCDVREILRQMLRQVYQGSAGSDPALWSSAFYQVFLMHRKNPVVREWIQEQYRAWEAFMATVIQRGQELGQIRSDIEARVIGNLIIGVFQGYEIRSTVDPELDVFEQRHAIEAFFIHDPGTS